MTVLVDRILSEDGNLVVAFTSEYGKAHATWIGDAPVPGSQYDVEVDIEATLQWGVDITSIDKQRFSIEENRGKILLCGSIDSYDDDGYTVLRLRNNIIPFMTSGQPYPTGKFVKVETQELALTPFLL